MAQKTIQGNQAVEIGNDGIRGEVIQDEAHRHGQPGTGRTVGQGHQLLECLGVEQVDQRVAGAVGVADGEEDGGLPHADALQADLPLIGKHPAHRVVAEGEQTLIHFDRF